MADIFFFTDPNSIVPQLNNVATGMAFGPIDINQYQITNQHKAIGNAKAIAVFDGIVVGVATGSDITLILKPKEPLKKLTDLDLPSIKYVIYKGIKTNSIIDGDDPLKIAHISKNDLTKIIWDTQTALNLNFGSSVDPSIGALRLNAGLLNDDKIDMLFEGHVGTDFEPAHVSAGDYIGDFINGVGELFGIEFLFNELRSKVTVGEVKNANFVIDVTGEVGARRKNLQERVIQFIDPAAFYGSLYAVETKNLSIRRVDDTPEANFKGKEVPLKFLSNLFNQHRIYFDIRNEFNRSYNNLLVYGSELKIKLGKKNHDYSAIDYYTHFSEWPILGIDPLVGVTSVYDKPDNVSNSVDIGLKLPMALISDDNTEPLILLYHNYFKLKIGLFKTIKPLKEHEKFWNPVPDGTEPGFLEELVFELPNNKVASNANEYTSPISTYVRLKMFREKSTFSSGVIAHRQENYLDALFLPFENTPKYNFGLEIRSFNEDIYLGTEVNIEEIIEDDRDGDVQTKFIGSVGYSYDEFNVNFFTFANKRKAFPVSKGKTERELIQVSDIEYYSEGSFLKTLGENYPINGSNGFGKTFINIPVPGFPDERQELYEYGLVTDVASADLASEFSTVIISKTTYIELSQAVDFGYGLVSGINPNYDIHLVFRNRQNFLADEVEQIDPDPSIWNATGNDVPYAVYELWLRGVKEDDPVGSSISEVEWNSGILLMSKQAKKSKVQNFVLVEQGVKIDGLKDNNAFSPCFKDTLNLKQKLNLERMIAYLYKSVPLDPMDPKCFRPNFDLADRVFRNTLGTGDKKFIFKIHKITINEYEVYFLNNPIPVTPDPTNTIANLPNDQVKGFILEAATVFASYDMLYDMLSSTEDNYIYERMFRVLANNGLKQDVLTDAVKAGIKTRLFNPFMSFGMWYGKDSDTVVTATGAVKDINEFSASTSYVDQYNNTGELSVNNIPSIPSLLGSRIMGDYLSQTSFKGELFNLVRQGNFDPVRYNEGKLEPIVNPLGDTILFNLPSKPTKGLLDPIGGGPVDYKINSVLDKTVKDYLEPIIGKIANEINTEFKYIINRNAKCYYNVFTKNLELSGTIEPEARLLASGEGSTTAGLLNIGPGDSITDIIGAPNQILKLKNHYSFGASTFTYNLDRLGNVQGIYSETFRQINRDASVAIHLSLYGMDDDLTPDIVEVELTGPFVGGSSGNKVLFRFVGMQSFDPTNKKIFPEPSLLSGGGVKAPELKFGGAFGSQIEERVNLETYGTSLLLLSGTIVGEDIVNSDFAFIDSRGNIGGVYLADWNNLIITKKPPYQITVRIFSGQSNVGSGNPLLPIHKDVKDFEEMQIGVNIAETIPSGVKRLGLYAQNLYPDDKFELTSAQKKDLIINTSLYPDAKASYGKLAKLIYNALDANPDNGGIDVSNIFINLAGENIGRPKNQVSNSQGPHNVAKDIRFVFDKPRPATLAADLGDVSWDEIDPSGDIDDLSDTYHPNDVAHDRTRLLEVPNGLPDAYNTGVRFSFGVVTVVLTKNNSGSMVINVESFVSPIWSRLDLKIKNDYRHGGGGAVEGLTKAERLNLLDSFTLYDDGTGGSDAYVKLGVSNYIPSYNPVLSCLRSFGLLEAIRDNIAYMVTEPIIDGGLELTSVEADLVRAAIQSQIDTIVIPANIFTGFTLDITYDLYKKLKWYSSSSDLSMYGNTI